MNALDILIDARNRIENGWSQGRYYLSSTDCYCAMGALNVAAGCESPSCDPSHADRNGEPHERACFFLANAVTGGNGDVGNVIDFNDADGRTKDEVLKAFDVAISNCKRRKTSSAPLRTAR